MRWRKSAPLPLQRPIPAAPPRKVVVQVPHGLRDGWRVARGVYRPEVQIRTVNSVGELDDVIREVWGQDVPPTDDPKQWAGRVGRFPIHRRGS